MRYTDDAVAGLLRVLDELRLTHRTLVVVTSDHGEAFGEHGVREHGRGLHEELLSVPLIWRAPGQIAAGHRVPELVGLIDLAPTVLELLDLGVPPWMQGISLVSRMDPAGPSVASAPRVLSSEDVLGATALRAQAWKAIFAAPRVTYFDLLSDREERAPKTSSSFEASARSARAALERDCERVRALIASDAQAPRPAAAQPDAERDRKLRALGYVD